MSTLKTLLKRHRPSSAAHRSAAKPDDMPTVFHLTHWKTGSQWLYQVLDACVPHRMVLPHPENIQVRHMPILPGMVYPTVYMGRFPFEKITRPQNSILFFVMRDPRDTFISWYFSVRNSHAPDHLPGDAVRDHLRSLPLEEGLRYFLYSKMPFVKHIQTSWVNSEVRIFRYEDFLTDPLGQFAALLQHCEIDVPSVNLAQTLKQFSFEARSGRARGSEDPNSHYRKGVAGDWVNYLKGGLLAEFKEMFDDTLIETGYESSPDWGLDLLDRRVAASPITRLKALSGARPTWRIECWCGCDATIDYGPDFVRCPRCATLISRHRLRLDDLIVTDEDDSLYGIRYWHDPRSYLHPHWNINLDALEGNAQSMLQNPYKLDVLRAILRFLPAGGRVLELGCGSGALAGLMDQAGYDVTALEMSESLVQFVADRFNVAVLSGPLEHQTLAAGSLDAIVLIDVLQALPDPLETLRHCKAALSKDGVLVLRSAVFNHQADYETLRQAGCVDLELLRPVEHQFVYTDRAMEQLLRAAGFGWVEAQHISQQNGPPLLVCGRHRREPRPSEAIRADLQAQVNGRYVLALLDADARYQQISVRRQQDEERHGSQLSRMFLLAQLQGEQVILGAGWNPFEVWEGETFRWVENDAEIIIADPTQTQARLHLLVEAGPGIGSESFRLKLIGQDGAINEVRQVKGRQWVEFAITLIPGQQAVFRLHTDDGGRAIASDPRILNFRVFEVDLRYVDGE